jgi:DNA-directed RNA polymerase specialized sigma24 family protein
VTLPRSNYRDRDVRYWLEGYAELKEGRDTVPGAPLHRLCCIADIHAAIDSLNPALRGAVLLVALFGYTTREAAELLGVAQRTVVVRYQRGREEIATYLNGGP